MQHRNPMLQAASTMGSTTRPHSISRHHRLFATALCNTSASPSLQPAPQYLRLRHYILSNIAVDSIRRHPSMPEGYLSPLYNSTPHSSSDFIQSYFCLRCPPIIPNHIIFYFPSLLACQNVYVLVSSTHHNQFHLAEEVQNFADIS